MKGKDKKESLIIYLDDDDTKKNIYAVITEKNNSFLSFTTETNNITIPINRVLKIKDEREGE